MKKLMGKIDRFCILHPRFGIPNLMLYIVIGNAIIWLFSLFDRSGAVMSMLYFSPYHILHGQVWRLVTFMLIPNNTGWLALITFYFYYFIGSTVERQWGTPKFNIYFFSGILLTVIYGFLIYFIAGINIPVSATYIYLSLFFCFATLYPDVQVLLFFIIPIKMKWLGILDALLFLYELITLPFPIDLLPVVAVLNYLIFCGGWLMDMLRFPSKKQRQRTVDFKREVKRIQQAEQKRSYTRRCEVCGRTDADYPGLEFRYCSRCAGYHCYCIDHINNHRHFTE